MVRAQAQIWLRHALLRLNSDSCQRTHTDEVTVMKLRPQGKGRNCGASERRLEPGLPLAAPTDFISISMIGYTHEKTRLAHCDLSIDQFAGLLTATVGLPNIVSKSAIRCTSLNVTNSIW